MPQRAVLSAQAFSGNPLDRTVLEQATGNREKSSSDVFLPVTGRSLFALGADRVPLELAWLNAVQLTQLEQSDGVALHCHMAEHLGTVCAALGTSSIRCVSSKGLACGWLSGRWQCTPVNRDVPSADANVAEGDIYQLGQYDNGSMCYAVDLTRLQDQALPALQHIHPEAALVDMRAALMTAAPPDIAVAGQAIALAQWHKVCPNNRQPYRVPGLPASFSQLQQRGSFKVSTRAQGGSSLDGCTC